MAPNFLIVVFLKVQLSSAANRLWSSFVSLCRWRFNWEIQRFFCEQGRQLAFRYHQHSLRCTPLSSHSAKHQQRTSIIAGLSPGDQSTLVSGRWSVPLRPSVCLSCAYDLLKIGKRRGNFKFIVHLMQDTSNLDSHRFNDWMTIGCKFGKNLL